MCPGGYRHKMKDFDVCKITVGGGGVYGNSPPVEVEKQSDSLCTVPLRRTRQQISILIELKPSN